MTRVLVVARGAAARARLETLLAGARGLRLVPAQPGVPVGRQINELSPDVLLLDLDVAGLETVLGEGWRATRVGAVLLVDSPRRVAAEAALARGPVRAVLPREATAGEIVAAAEAVAAGLVVFHPEALRPRATRSLGAEGAPVEPLTGRELEVLAMLAEGLGNKTIAAKLGISTHTAKFHVAAILAKLGAGSRTEAVTIGMRRGLVAI